MDAWFTRAAGVVGTAVGALLGLVAIQLLRLRRMQFLPPHPGFEIDHVVRPTSGEAVRGTLRLVVLGDSTTAGVGVDRPEDALPHLIAQGIADAEKREVHVVNYGWAGARAANLVPEQLPRALEPIRPDDPRPFIAGADVVAVVIGANDATHRTRPARFRADLRATFEAVRAAAPHARVVHAGIPAFRGALRTLEPLMLITDSYARVLRPISRQESERCGVAYADLARDVPPRIRGRRDFLSSDQFHPSAFGYGIWAQVIVEALRGPAPEPAPEPIGLAQRSRAEAS
ncbi:MAG TPA: GDSL-type esterase/lipase family protein [Candidatus Limnocylindria bacterium]